MKLLIFLQLRQPSALCQAGAGAGRSVSGRQWEQRPEKIMLYTNIVAMIIVWYIVQRLANRIALSRLKVQFIGALGMKC
jgi:hypothetical protein